MDCRRGECNLSNVSFKAIEDSISQRVDIWGSNRVIIAGKLTSKRNGVVGTSRLQERITRAISQCNTRAMRPGHVPYHPSRRVGHILQGGNEGGGVKKEKEHDYGHPLEKHVWSAAKTSTRNAAFQVTRSAYRQSISPTNNCMFRSGSLS